MLISGPVSRRVRPHARTALWLVAFALLLRAFVPVGYMPDAHASRDGRVAITFCTAAGDVKVMDVLLGTQRADADHKDESSALADCAFAVLAHLAQDLPSTINPVLVQVSQPLTLPVIAQRIVAANLATGPPLGSRAPPQRTVSV